MARDIKLVDPLSEVTRKERRMLLGLSVLSVFIIKTGAVPTKLGALGIEFGNSDQQAFLWLLAAVLVYFIVAFLVYAVSDFLAWRKDVLVEHIEWLKEYWVDAHRGPSEPSDLQAIIEHDEREVYRKNRLWLSLTTPVSISRAVFEFLLPLGVGLYAVYEVAFKAFTTS